MKKKKSQKDEEVSAWKGRVTRMKNFQKKHSATWKRNEQLLWGTDPESKDGNRSEVAYGWGLVKALETSIYVQNPEMAAEPYDSKNMELAKNLTSLSNYDIDMMDLKSIGNIGLIDNFTCGYFAAIECLENEKDTVDDDGNERVVMRDQRYEARRIAPRDLLVHPATLSLDLHDSPYIAVATYPTVQEILDNDELYPDAPGKDELMEFPEASSDKRGTGIEAAKGGEVRAGQQLEKDPAFKTICVWEIHNKIEHKIEYISDHLWKKFGSIPWEVRFKFGTRDLYSVTLMAFHPQPNVFYPKPELDLIANQLLVMNRIDNMIYVDALTKWRKFGTYSDVMPSDQVSKLTDTTIENAVLTVATDQLTALAGTGQNFQLPNIQEIVAPIADPSPKKDLFVVRDMIKEEITDIIGYGPPQRGGLPKTRSAREAVAIKERLEARLAKRSDAVADFYRLFGMKHIQFLQQTMEIERYTRVFDSAKDLAEFRNYKREDISGDFNFIVYAGTSAPRSTEAKRNQEMELFKVLMPFGQAGLIAIPPILMRLAEAMQWKGVDALLRNPVPQAKQTAVTLAKAQQGQVKPGEVEEAAAALVKAVLTPEQLKMLLQEVSGMQEQNKSTGPPGTRGDPDAGKTGQAAM